MRNTLLFDGNTSGVCKGVAIELKKINELMEEKTYYTHLKLCTR